MPDCIAAWVAVVVLSLALLISFSLNLIFYFLRRKASLCRDSNTSWDPQICEQESLSRNDGHYFHDLNHHEQQENPIYGNIHTGSADVCYEMMAMQHTNNGKRSLESDVNYASLDLKVAQKRKKNHHLQSRIQGCNKLQDHLPVTSAHSVTPFLEIEADMDACLPSKNNSTMVSHSSIYLNSQQIAQETEAIEGNVNVPNLHPVVEQLPL
ncbi:uncharacterized protein LOC117517344 isoform X2 [Thalassophryne amazonica]|uniref:uncharacterized protein LOC117517344 isoform X2 n=1 Tax=Thalassophryne amazonica TaxID=390379 RepID=UPI001470FFBF|nr:uncharacterized protein LOC117517344 isoform X2 [Thalassophryne amazonica]